MYLLNKCTRACIQCVYSLKYYNDTTRQNVTVGNGAMPCKLFNQIWSLLWIDKHTLEDVLNNYIEVIFLESTHISICFLLAVFSLQLYPTHHSCLFTKYSYTLTPWFPSLLH